VSLHDVGDEAAVLCFWSLSNASPLGQWRPESGKLRAFAVSQDGTQLATATVTDAHEHLIEVWGREAILGTF
jgi:hypothetical protein